MIYIYVHSRNAPKLGPLNGFEILLDGGIKIFERAV